MVPNNANTFLPPTPVVPGNLIITNISRSYPMVVTIVDSDENTYIVGQAVYLTVTPPYKMIQANTLIGEIVSITGDDFSLNIDSRGFDTFVTAPSGTSQPASLSPAGSRNLQFNNTTADVVPFQSLNNQGN